MLVLAVMCIGRYHITTISQEARKILGLKENDEIEWILENGKLLLERLRKATVIADAFFPQDT